MHASIYPPIGVISLSSVDSDIGLQLILSSTAVCLLVGEGNSSSTHPEDAVCHHVLLVGSWVEGVGGDLSRNKQGNAVGTRLQDSICRTQSDHSSM